MRVSPSARYSANTLIAVVRDVSERYKRFEAERRATRDMHTANRFTRHEVKNGLLSGIELTHTLRQAVTTFTDACQIDEPSETARDQVDEYLNELDRTLHSVLNTVSFFWLSRYLLVPQVFSHTFTGAFGFDGKGGGA